MLQKGLFSSIRRCLSTSTSTAPSSSPSVPVTSIKAALLLTRAPIVSRDLSQFEKVYYNYQEELERRLMWTFPHYYYFKKGSLSERKFVQAQKGPVSKQPGVFYEKGVPDVVHNRERRLKQDVIIPKDEYEESTMSDISKPVIPNSRITKADETGDIKSLERELPRTLYLLTKDSKLGWKLPSFGTEERRALHKVAESGLRELGGEEINTWTVARAPAAVLKYQKNKLVDAKASAEDLTREYVIKSHILSGAFKPKDVEYAWLTREEIQEKVTPEYFEATEFLFSRV